MKSAFSFCLFALLALIPGATADCESEKEIEIKEATKLSFIGFTPEVSR